MYIIDIHIIDRIVARRESIMCPTNILLKNIENLTYTNALRQKT